MRRIFILALVLMLCCLPWASAEVYSEERVCQVSLNGKTVMALRQYTDEGERMIVGVLDNSTNDFIWADQTWTSCITELDQTDVFVNYEHLAEPLIIVYNAEVGLCAVDVDTGLVQWSLDGLDLGGSISWTIGGDGTMYIGGYYGPDPVAISPAGYVKWQSYAGPELYGLYELHMEGEKLIAVYENSGESGYAIFDTFGSMIDSYY